MKKVKMILSTLVIGGLITSFGATAFASSTPANYSSKTSVSVQKKNPETWVNTCVNKGIIPQKTADKIINWQNKAYQGKAQTQLDNTKADPATLDQLIKDKIITQRQAEKIKLTCPGENKSINQKKWDISNFQGLTGKKILTQDQVNKITKFEKTCKISPDKDLTGFLNMLVKAKIISQKQADQIIKVITADQNRYNPQR